MNSAVDLPLGAAELTFEAAGESLVRRSVLPSGVRVLSERVPGSRSATVGFWIAVGSRDEHPASAGLPATYGSTHFLEHLLFKGTRTRSALDIAVSFDAVGGEHNALTAKEYTCYYAKVQDKDLPMAVEVLADMLTSSLLDPVEFENERGVILEELSMAGDDPADVANERFFEAVLGEHPLGRPIGGDADTIRAATRDAVWQHYRANYRPRDLVVTVAGAVDHDRVVDALGTALAAGGWDLDTAAPPVDRRPNAPALLDGAGRLTVVERPNEQVNLLLGVPGLLATDDRRATLSVLNAVFGSGMSSRLFQEVRERRGLAYAVYSFAPGYSDAGLFGMYAGCAPAKAPTVAALMRAELERVATDGVTDDELARAAGQLGGASALALEDSDTRMSRLGRAELTLGEFADLDEALRRIALVTVDDVRSLAADLVSRPFSLVAVGATDEAAFRGVVDEAPPRTDVA
ncbi:M16 family metallopeptidase [Agromyces larvae]|uniref:Insulinase family protein n=1 Tax=Agromyces larvae TaxID=2929802 RepID=A0ABY4C040_9MICO|nr:pitrilysin family protein [Agromyces larvae]UOE44734.1 insulinase family protein [Agromyces larvae]